MEGMFMNILEMEKSVKAEMERIEASGDISREAKEKCVPLLNSMLDILFAKIANRLYASIEEHPIVSASSMLYGYDDIKNKTLVDYDKIFTELRKISNGLKGSLVPFVDKYYGSNKPKRMEELVSEYQAAEGGFYKLVDEYVKIIGTARYLTEVCKKKSNVAYMKEVLKSLPVVEESLRRAEKIYENVEMYDINNSGYDNLHETMEFIDGSFGIITTLANEVLSLENEKRLEEQKKNAIKAVEGRVVKFETPKTQRELLIEKARAKYQMFCDDFMRDLNNQYALSSRDLYQEFVNVTFKKFVKKYMPIKDSIKEDRAKEIIFAIDDLINEVANISSNSYVTSMYSQKQ